MAYRVKGVKKLAEKIGFTNVFVSYSKEEGWWLESDQYDNYVGMDSGIIELQLKRIYEKSTSTKVQFNNQPTS
jgi:hypothetical protein